MVSERDINTFQEAGITDLDQLVHAAAAFLRTYPLYRNVPNANHLSADEKVILIAEGACGVDGSDDAAYKGNLTIVAAEYALMVTTALSYEEVADKLGTSIQSVQQRIGSRTLYAIKGSSGYVCPQFQFSGNASLPGLEVVLAKISEEAHPIAVQRFFLTPTVDLEPEEIGHPLSPREWLLRRYSMEPVITLASEL